MDIIGTPPEFARRMAFATGAGAFVGLIGPFGSYGGAPLERKAAWVVCFWAGALINGGALKLAGRWSARSNIPRGFARSVAVMAGAAPLAAISATCFHFILGVSVSATHWLLWYAQVLAISFPVALGYLLFSGMGSPGPQELAQQADPAPTVEPAPAAAESLVMRLPPRLGRQIVALQMEDHYVRVHTPFGSELILIPMSQAVESLSGTEGLRVHRSWWVSRIAVEGQVLEGRNLRLRLRGGIEAPVARAAVAQVRAAGWLTLAQQPGDGP